MITVLIGKFHDSEVEWPLFTEEVPAEVRRRWRADLDREVKRRLKAKLTTIGRRSIVERDESCFLTEGERVNQRQEVNGVQGQHQERESAA